jgi:hypothetical protein
VSSARSISNTSWNTINADTDHRKPNWTVIELEGWMMDPAGCPWMNNEFDHQDKILGD